MNLRTLRYQFVPLFIDPHQMAQPIADSDVRCVYASQKGFLVEDHDPSLITTIACRTTLFPCDTVINVDAELELFKQAMALKELRDGAVSEIPDIVGLTANICEQFERKLNANACDSWLGWNIEYYDEFRREIEYNTRGWIQMKPTNRTPTHAYIYFGFNTDRINTKTKEVEFEFPIDLKYRIKRLLLKCSNHRKFVDGTSYRYTTWRYEPTDFDAEVWKMCSELDYVVRKHLTRRMDSGYVIVEVSLDRGINFRYQFIPTRDIFSVDHKGWKFGFDINGVWLQCDQHTKVEWNAHTKAEIGRLVALYKSLR